MTNLKLIKTSALPFKRINEVIGANLKCGKVALESKARKKIYDKHRDCYAQLVAHFHELVSQVLYVGQSPHNQDSFEIIAKVEEQLILIAISHQAEHKAKYHVVKSAYLISEQAIERRLRTGHLKKLGHH